MGVTKYAENGKDFFKVYIHVRSPKSRKVRAQKLIIGIETEDEALRLDKKWTQWAYSQVAKRENDGLTWGEVVEAWREWYRRFPSNRWDEGTVQDYIALTRNWTAEWLDKPATKLTVTDSFELIEEARKKGASIRRLYQIKTTVNVIFKWGMGAGKILGKDHSPFFGVDLPKKGEESEPEILNRDEFANLLERARLAEHEWYPVWKLDAHTGLRASELDGLRKEDFEMVAKDKAMELDRSSDAVKNYGMIRVQRQWKKKLKCYGALKGRYWRTVPISSQLYWFLHEYLENDFGSDVHGRRVFPVLAELRRGQQALVLKSFCLSEGLKEIKFHTLRACFATHLLATGVSESKVMKIGGWKDRETMMVYIRLSGIDEAGATEGLDLRPKQEPIREVQMPNVVNLFRRK
ncbi:MAG: tyrosine-type recombinase/integrase [Bdellovibrionales bacterium]